MYHLTNDIAARRLHYPSPMAGAPHAVLLDPVGTRGAGLALGRYYVVLPETDDELLEFERFLVAPRLPPARPDLLDERPLAVRSGTVTIIRYAPPCPGGALAVDMPLAGRSCPDIPASTVCATLCSAIRR